MKRTLAILLSIVMLFSVLPLTALAAEVDTADTGAGELTIVKQPPEELNITYSEQTDNNYLYPYITFGVQGGSGSYTYSWYYDGSTEGYYSFTNKVATTTAPVYQVDRVGYWHCRVSDGKTTLSTDQTKVTKSETQLLMRARVNGTKLEWLQSPAETIQSEVQYTVIIYRLDTSHTDFSLRYALEIKRNSDNIVVIQGKGKDGTTLGDRYLSDFQAAYDSRKHIYSTDIKSAISGDSAFDDVKYLFNLYDDSYRSSAVYARIDFQTAKALYNGEVTAYSDATEHMGEIQIMGDVHPAGTVIEPNMNGGRWADANSIKYVVYLQKQGNDGLWYDVERTNSYTLTDDDVGKRFRFRLKPNAFTGRVAGVNYWYEDSFFSNAIQVSKRIVEVTGPIYCTFTEPKVGEIADTAISVSDSDNGNFLTLATNTSSGTGLDWWSGNMCVNDMRLAGGKTYSAYVYFELNPNLNEQCEYDFTNLKVYFNDKPAVVSRHSTYLVSCKLEYPLEDVPVTGSTVSGTATSYLSDTDTVTVQLLQSDSVKYSTTVTGKTASYSIPNVANGSYTLRVSKNNHVTRDYSVTVSGNITQDVKIHPLGDINGDGKTNTRDFGMAYAHAQKLPDSELTGYALKCGDVVKNDGQIKTADAARIYAHAQKLDLLW